MVVLTALLLVASEPLQVDASERRDGPLPVQEPPKWDSSRRLYLVSRLME